LALSLKASWSHAHSSFMYVSFGLSLASILWDFGFLPVPKSSEARRQEYPPDSAVDRKYY